MTGYTTDRLTRFLRQSGHYSGGRVKHNAFIPPRGRTDISMFAIDGLATGQVWELGSTVFPADPPRARADVRSVVLRELKLGIEPDNVPPRHVNVVGFPDDKAQQKEMALVIAEHCELVLA